MLKIYTISCGRTDFIEMQLGSFQKHLQDFEFTVFNNAIFDSKDEYHLINETCKRLGVQVSDVEPDEQIIQQAEQTVFSGRRYLNANIANAYPLNYAWQKVISRQNSPVCILDSDGFLIQPFEITEYLQNYQLCFIKQSRPGVEYMWNAFAILDVPNLPEPKSLNWYCGLVRGTSTDVGGQTSRYLESHPELKQFHIRPAYTEFDVSTNFTPADYETFWMGDKEVALHYRSGSNWNHRSADYHQKKTKWLRGRLGL